MKAIFKNISLLPLIFTAAVLGGVNGEPSALGNSVVSSADQPASTPQRPAFQERFECTQNGGKYSTIAHTARGPIEIIVWESKFFGGKWTPAVRCQSVSTRFQALASQGRLQYLNAGRMNNENVICVTSKTGKEGCLEGGLLLTMEPKDNPYDVLNELFYSRQNPSAGGMRRNNGQPIDFTRLLMERAPMAESSGVPSTRETVPSSQDLEKEDPAPKQPMLWGK